MTLRPPTLPTYLAWKPKIKRVYPIYMYLKIIHIYVHVCVYIICSYYIHLTRFKHGICHPFRRQVAGSVHAGLLWQCGSATLCSTMLLWTQWKMYMYIYIIIYMYMYACVWENPTFCKFHQNWDFGITMYIACPSYKFAKYEHLQLLLNYSTFVTQPLILPKMCVKYNVYTCIWR